MHTGKITLLGRIMAGSQAVIAHNEAGHALFVKDDPPDIHVTQVLVAYGPQVALATGSFLLVIDRAVNSQAMAWAFDAQDLGGRCMLDDNEHHGLESFAATVVDLRKDGTKVSRGAWHVPRPKDPRPLVIVEPAEGTIVVHWGTSKVKDPLEPTPWPRVDRERNAMQDNGFKRLIDHGALKTNDGRKTIGVADRHQQRQSAQREQSLEAAHKRVDKQAEALKAHQDKVAESASQGHGTRLAQRQRALVRGEQECKDAQHQHANLTEQAAAIGPPRERADRDFRTQTSMTFRTLLLENALMAFMGMRCERLQTTVSLDCLLRRLFARSGARMETASQVVYWVNTVGVSLSYRRLLTEVVEGLGAMDLRAQGKPICVRLKDIPP